MGTRTFKFTEVAIKNLATQDGQIDYYDAVAPLPGQSGQLGIRVGKASKTWFVQYRANGKRKKISLSPKYPGLSLKNARIVAAERLKVVYSGGDPSADAKAYREAPTMEDLWGAYVTKRDQQARKKAATTISEEDRRWSKVIMPAFGHMKVEDVQPMHISELLDKVAKRGPVSANRLHTLLQILFKPALAKGWITIHPVQWIDKPGGSEAPRKRVLSDDEIRAVWPCFDELSHNHRDISRLGLLTAQRPGEIKAMRWSELDFDELLWRQGAEDKDTKTGNVHLTPLSSQVVDILQARRNPETYTKKTMWMLESDFVFPTKHNRTRGKETIGHTISLKGSRSKVQGTSGVYGWTSHDLRRTARTLMSRLQIEHHVREAVLNHSLGKIAKTYDQYDYLPEKRQALQKLANEIDTILGVAISKAGKIISFAR